MNTVKNPKNRIKHLPLYFTLCFWVAGLIAIEFGEKPKSDNEDKSTIQFTPKEGMPTAESRSPIQLNFVKIINDGYVKKIYVYLDKAEKRWKESSAGLRLKGKANKVLVKFITFLQDMDNKNKSLGFHESVFSLIVPIYKEMSNKPTPIKLQVLVDELKKETWFKESDLPIEIIIEPAKWWTERRVVFAN